jgi:glucose-6-phosphate isomerase
MPELNAFHLGGLLMTFEIATAVMGHLFGINAFDQPGVELGKRYLGALLKRPGYDDAAKELASATNRQRELIIT